MSDVVIRVENLSKLYRIGAQERYKAFRDTLTEAVTKPFRWLHDLWSGNGASPPDSADNTFWALKDVSFEVKQGEVIGIIGRNGAGKSTLLKILSRITEPTAGFAEIRGRVGSLLEVGTGFHPELTGRENIYLNGAILGMHRSEIRRKFDEIVAFAEVEKFIDTPVKHYSSGMYLRLAFAVAAHLEPEILLVDEVLAVGDAAFQKKCLGKMGDVAREGRTVLFVSHNMVAVSHLCSSCVILKDGILLAKGKSNDIVEMYLSNNNCNNFSELSFHENRLCNGNQALKWIEIKGHNRIELVCGEPAIITIGFVRQMISSYPEIAFTVETLFGQRVFSFATYWTKRTQDMDFSDGIAYCLIDKLPLAPGIYSINIAIGTANNLFQDHIRNACQFEVISTDYYGTGKIPSSAHGVILIDASWFADNKTTNYANQCLAGNIKC